MQRLAKHRQGRKEVDRLESLERKVSAHVKRQRELQTALAKLPTISQPQLKKLETAERDIRDKRVQVEACGLTVEVVADKQSEVQVLESGKRRSEALENKKPRTFKAAQRLELKLSGWGKVAIHSGSDEIKNLVEDLKAAEAALDEALLAHGIESVAAARTALASRKDTRAANRCGGGHGYGPAGRLGKL